jgi:hypothetical protein
LNKETSISICILIILAGIGAGVFIKQFYFNPAVLTAKELVPEDTTLQDSGSAPESDSMSPEDKNKLLPVPDGMVSMTKPEQFSPDTLYEKINGKAELYLSAGFKRLLCHRLKDKASSDAGLWMEAYVYQMEGSTNAFAVFSRQRRSDGTALDLAEFAYRTKNAVFFCHGEYYVELVGSTSEEKLFSFMYEFTERFIANVDVKTEGKKEFDLFPKEGLVPESISLIPSNAFGYDQLNNIYIATYKKEGKQATLFLSNRNAPEDASRLSSGYKSFLEMFGGTPLPPDIDVENAILVEIFGTYDLFFTFGNYFAGVHESEDIPAAKALATAFLNHLQTKTDGKTKPKQ